MLVFILCLFSFSMASPHGGIDPTKLEETRAKVISYILKTDLGRYHFTKKKIDDELSRAAFRVYLKQLDPQKRYLTKEDVAALRTYADKIDDEINSGNIDLPGKAEGILDRRIPEVAAMVREILSKDFDFSKDETIETDFDKIDYCSTQDELKERWRKTLKYQVLHRYLSLLDDQKALEKDAASAHTDKPGSGQKEGADLLRTAREKVLKSYETIFARLHQDKLRDRYDRFFEAFAKAFDPHTDFMPPLDKEDFDIGMTGQLEGIGATLKEEDGYVKVVSVVPGGPAYREGSLQPDDTILKVSEGKSEPVDISDMKLRDAIKLIRGKKGTQVTLTVKKLGGRLATIHIVRDVVQLEDGFVKGVLLRDNKTGKSFGYIKIPAFYRDFERTRNGASGRNSTDDLRKELKNFGPEKISGLILDLRNNGGGALTDAVKTAGLFIKTGPVVQVKNMDGKVSVLSDDDPEIAYGGPIIVLVNKFSASASEILAGALQDYGRAVIIGGEHTHGKGTVQTILDLNDELPLESMESLKPLGALKLTTQKFYRITGASTQYRGITPDIVLPDRFTGLRSGEQYLDYALPWDTISPTRFTEWRHVRPYMADLRAKSLARVKSEKDFTDIAEYSRITTEEVKNTVRSLNLDQAKKELEQTRILRDKEVGVPDGHSPEDKKNGHVLSAGEKAEQWDKEVREDAYVREAISVIKDLISDQNKLSLN